MRNLLVGLAGCLAGSMACDVGWVLSQLAEGESIKADVPFLFGLMCSMYVGMAVINAYEKNPADSQ